MGEKASEKKGELEEILYDMIIEKYGTMIEFTRSIQLPNSTVVGILKRGANKAGVENIVKICEALGISVDELARGRIVAAESQESEASDFAVELELLLILLKSDGIIFDGKPLTKFERGVIRQGILLGLDGVRELREAREAGVES